MPAHGEIRERRRGAREARDLVTLVGEAEAERLAKQIVVVNQDNLNGFGRALYRHHLLYTAGQWRAL